MIPSSADAAVPRSSAPYTVAVILFLAASSAPTPLYRLYQQQWGFSPLMLTVVFAVYALSQLAALLVFGSLSDRIGRRPVILTALALELVSIALFLTAPDVAWLLLARLLQGFATGTATASLGAALLDTGRERGALINALATMLGTGIGAIGSSLLAHFAPAPLQLGFGLLFVAFAAQIAWTAATPESALQLSRDGWSWRPRIAVPAQARAAFAAASPTNLAVWAIGGFFLALMPSILAEMAGPDAAWIGGLAVAALTFGAAAIIFVIRNRGVATALTIGAAGLIAGPIGIVAGANLASPGVLLVGSVAAGFGLGAGFLGAVRSVTVLALPQQRGALMAAIYIQGYLAYALPAVIAGYFVPQIGLLATADAFGAAIVLLGSSALVIAITRPRVTPPRPA